MLGVIPSQPWQLLPKGLGSVASHPGIAAQMCLSKGEGNYTDRLPEAHQLFPLIPVALPSPSPSALLPLRCSSKLPEQSRSCHPCKHCQNNFQGIRKLVQITGTWLHFSISDSSHLYGHFFLLSKGGNAPYISFSTLSALKQQLRF